MTQFEQSIIYGHLIPWWTTTLSDLWFNLSRAEKCLLDCNNRADKTKLKAIYVKLRKQFDTKVQRAKRLYRYNMQQELLDECNVDKSCFWKSVGKIGVGHASKKAVPDEVVLDNGAISSDTGDVLHKWKIEFCSLLNNPNTVNRDLSILNNVFDNSLCFNNDISIFEVKKAIDAGKRGKACGMDSIPTEALQNDTAIVFLHALFNICFKTGKILTIWGKSVINPVPKSASMDPRNPLSYKGISLSCSVYKLYCYILNDRLGTWAENENIVVDEQNGLRKKRSTIDHLSTLTNIIGTRNKHKQ
ncbi:uncharacterized protein LOC128547041 [Mercenaria mercenaria]|uniref:uncharacterized protein LOC128547041 n=1 Tax=Mercenaria mercenaria TaxID=6596 RepID=UPI00234F9C83|nr:uncharacterized protein LOC128547041 [Mercenaria mercenaria]